MSLRQGYGSGQRMRLCDADRMLPLVAEEPLRTLEWYARVARDVADESPSLHATVWDRLRVLILAVPLGLTMAHGRLRGLVDGPGGGTVGDYD